MGGNLAFGELQTRNGGKSDHQYLFNKFIKHCPTCRGQAPTIRNLAMEKVAATVYFPCKYHASGCQNSFLHDKKAAHEGL